MKLGEFIILDTIGMVMSSYPKQQEEEFGEDGSVSLPCAGQMRNQLRKRDDIFATIF